MKALLSFFSTKAYLLYLILFVLLLAMCVFDVGGIRYYGINRTVGWLWIDPMVIYAIAVLQMVAYLLGYGLLALCKAKTNGLLSLLCTLLFIVVVAFGYILNVEILLLMEVIGVLLFLTDIAISVYKSIWHK